ncbi:MAG: hypothetical protein WBP72_12980 [Rhodocyclaceae bacterium]
MYQKQGRRAPCGPSFFSRTACCLAALGLAAGSVQAADPAEAIYSIIDLGTLGGSDSTGLALNNAGQVVGWSLDQFGRRRAFLHSRGQTRDIGTLGGEESSATDISEAGHIVGYSVLPPDESGRRRRHAFRYEHGTMQDLGTLGGSESFANAVNKAGQVVGYARNSSGEVRGFRTVGSTLRDIGQLSSIGFNIYPNSINRTGQVVGAAPNSQNFLHAFLYSGEVMADLGTLGGGTSFATRINDRGDVTGYAETAGNVEHAFLFSPGKGMRDLGTLGGRISKAYGLNNRRQVVGYSLDQQNANQLAFGYDAAVGMVDLNWLVPADSAWILRSANAINDRGQITGWGSIAGEGHAFLMTPNFPKAPTLDSFDRSEGELGANWSGDTDSSAFLVEKGQLRVRNGGTIYWKYGRFGEDQDAFVTFERVGPRSTQGIALKVQTFGNAAPDARNGAIVLVYDAERQSIRLGTLLPRGRGWTVYPPVTAKFQDGDQFGARAYSTGEVRVYRNHLPIHTIKLNPSDTEFFGSRGGTVGVVSLPAAGQAALSQFGGGTSPD